MASELTSLELAGFQVFETLTHIPIKRITLLFGPNSAGKSAVEDALLIASKWLGDSSSDTLPSDRSKRFKQLKRHWRKTGGGEKDYSPILRLHLGIRIPAKAENILTYKLTALFAKAEESGFSEADYSEIQVKYTFHLETTSDNPEDFGCARNIEVLINDEPVVSLIEFEKLGVNLAHPFIIGISNGYDFQIIAGKYPDLLSVEDGWVWIHGPVELDENKQFDIGLYKFGVEEERQWREGIGEEGWVKDGEHGYYFVLPEVLYKALKEVSRILDCTLNIFSNVKIRIPIVPASRRIPSEQDLTFLVSSCRSDDDPLRITSFNPQGTQPRFCDNPLKEFGFTSQGAPEYSELARSFASALFPQNAEMNATDATTQREADRELANNVNYMLREHLFTEKGYRIDWDYRAILNPEQYKEIIDGSTDEDLIREFVGLVRLFLVDASGRKYSFSEVGSGLGYVLPVLCALSGDIALLQQPELHLHPALQAALGDVFIESTNRKDGEYGQKRLMIETHSEYILLRALRRIKQTYEKRVSPELFIEPDDVAVLYFDPRPDDTTRVTRLRISHGGEFLDRWPRGFFAERDKELFDDNE